MGTEPISTSPSIPGSLKIVSPYGANIDTRISGSVRYTDGFINHHSQMGTVSSFIRSWTNDSFHATRMMVAEWDGVAQQQGSSVSLIISDLNHCNVHTPSKWCVFIFSIAVLSVMSCSKE